jgi:hypothetical protein
MQNMASKPGQIHLPLSTYFHESTGVFSQSATVIHSGRCQPSSTIKKTASRSRLETTVGAVRTRLTCILYQIRLYLVQVKFLMHIVHILTSARGFRVKTQTIDHCPLIARTFIQVPLESKIFSCHHL